MSIADESLSGDSQAQNDSQTLESAPTSIYLHLTSFLVDSHARTSVSPAMGLVSMETAADSGGKCSESLASYDRSSLLWRTSQLCLDGGLAEFSETWPRSGMTQSGTAYRLQPLALPIAATESGLLPTPNSQDWQPICWKRAERLIKGLKGREMSGNNGGCMNLQDSMAAGWMLLEKLETRPPRGNMPRVSPCYWEYLMGFPNEWSALEQSETPSSRKSPNGSQRGSRQPLKPKPEAEVRS
jgi:hypothetical protein